MPSFPAPFHLQHIIFTSQAVVHLETTAPFLSPFYDGEINMLVISPEEEHSETERIRVWEGPRGATLGAGAQQVLPQSAV